MCSLVFPSSWFELIGHQVSGKHFGISTGERACGYLTPMDNIYNPAEFARCRGPLDFLGVSYCSIFLPIKENHMHPRLLLSQALIADGFYFY